MLTLSGISKAYGGRVLFDDVALQVNREDRIGLVGPNGAGKSTLFSIILGKEAPDSGLIDTQRGIQIGYLPQEQADVGNETVLEIAAGVTPELVTLRRQLKAWEAGHEPGEAIEDDIQGQYEHLGGFHYEVKARKILAGLSFREKDFDRPARELSGGWTMRAYLARLLVLEPDLLLLDEPTNHLDLQSLIWFQEYLRSYPGALLMISHDRSFLNELVTSILELRMSRMFRYRGNYDSFLEQREAQEEQLVAAYKNQQREIARLQRFVDRFRAKNTKAAQAQSKLKQIERMEIIEAPDAQEATIDFSFPQPQRSGQRAITLEGVHYAYGSQIVYNHLDFQAERGQRLVLVGPNGAGKSTLLKLLAGVLEPQGGICQPGHNVKRGYYAQYRTENLHPEMTVLEEAFDTPQRLTETFVRSVLGCFLFRGDDVFKKVSVLSGGEKSRLALVKLLLDPPNLLLMDEPTTHLDLASVDALLYALSQYEGTIIFISHDVYFIKSLANQVVHVRDGRLTWYAGDYDYYLDKSKDLRAAEALALAPPPPQEPDRARVARERKEQKRLEAERRQALYRERVELRKKVSQLEAEIGRLETRQAELTAALQDPSTYQDSSLAVSINEEMREVLESLHRNNTEWESAAMRLEAVEAESNPGGQDES